MSESGLLAGLLSGFSLFEGIVTLLRVRYILRGLGPFWAVLWDWFGVLVLDLNFERRLLSRERLPGILWLIVFFCLIFLDLMDFLKYVMAGVILLEILVVVVFILGILLKKSL